MTDDVLRTILRAELAPIRAELKELRADISTVRTHVDIIPSSIIRTVIDMQQDVQALKEEINRASRQS